MRSSCVTCACFHLVYYCKSDGRPDDVEFGVGVGVGVGAGACRAVVEVPDFSQAGTIAKANDVVMAHVS